MTSIGIRALTHVNRSIKIIYNLLYNDMLDKSLMKGKAPRKHSLHEKTAASVY